MSLKIMKVVEAKHPMIKHKLGLMRAKNISTQEFRRLTQEIASLLTYEVTANFETEKTEINSLRKRNGLVRYWYSRIFTGSCQICRDNREKTGFENCLH